MHLYGQLSNLQANSLISASKLDDWFFSSFWVTGLSSLRSLHVLFSCKYAALHVLMYVCPSVCGQFEIIPSYSIQCNSIQFQTVPECSRMHADPWDYMQAPALAVSKVQYNNVIPGRGLFWTKSTVSVLCWSNLQTFSISWLPAWFHDQDQRIYILTVATITP